MIRTIISLKRRDKAWLSKIAKKRRISMAAVVRTAIDHYRQETDQAVTMEQLLDQTSGMWQHGDGLDYQNKIRDEWDKS